MNTLFTVGYSGISLEEFAGAVLRNNWYVIDTRLSPRSRRAEWNANRLRQALGTRYAHHIELGNVNYKTGGDIRLNDPETGLRYIEHALKTHEVVLLCGCADVAHCHRKVIADLMTERAGCVVKHLGIEDFRQVSKPEKPKTLPMF